MVDLAALIKETDNEFAAIAVDMDESYGFIDTGSYALNALVSGSIHGGLADTKCIGFAGEEATGKSFFVLAAAKAFLDADPTAMVAYFESEHALDKDTVASRGIDMKRFAVLPVPTVEQFRTQAAKMLDKYRETPESKRPRLMFILDSLGNLSTMKEIADVTAGSDKRDMTRTQIIRGAFRVLTLKMGLVNVPLLVANHIYTQQGVSFGDPRVMSGGGGLKYAATTILFLSKAQFKEGDERMGSVITVTATKSRLTREGKKVKVLLHAEHGLDRYYGLLSLAEDAGIVTKTSNKFQFPNGDKAFESAIHKNPEKYFTEEMLDMIEQYVQQTFKFGKGEGPKVDDDIDGDEA